VNNDSIATGTITVLVVISIGILLLLMCCCSGYFFVVKKSGNNEKNIEITELSNENSDESEVNAEQLVLSFSPSASSSFLQQAGISRHQELSAKFADLGVASVEDFVWFGKNVTDAVMTEEIGMSQTEIAAFRNASVDVEEGKICDDEVALGSDESADFLNLLRTQRLLAECGAQSSNIENSEEMLESLAMYSNNDDLAQSPGTSDDLDMHKVMSDEELASFELLSRMQELLAELPIEPEVETTADKVDTTSRLARRLEHQNHEQDIRRGLHTEFDLSSTSPLGSGD